jgi:hypothetical protein
VRTLVQRTTYCSLVHHGNQHGGPDCHECMNVSVSCAYGMQLDTSESAACVFCTLVQQTTYWSLVHRGGQSRHHGCAQEMAWTQRYLSQLRYRERVQRTTYRSLVLHGGEGDQHGTNCPGSMRVYIHTVCVLENEYRERVQRTTYRSLVLHGGEGHQHGGARGARERRQQRQRRLLLVSSSSSKKSGANVGLK